MSWFERIALVLLGLMLALAAPQPASPANRISDVRGTKHNLSAAPDLSATPSGGRVPARDIKAASETQVCVFCHTPHQGEIAPGAPLWNRKLSGATYTTYTSSSIEANAAELAAAPGGTSKLCLSCHDGTLAIANVNVLDGQAAPAVAMNAAATAQMPPGSGTATGFTRNLGTSLSNDHPISFTYDSTLAGADGELRTPDGVTVGNRVAGAASKPLLPLENNQMHCATCHDPHIRDVDITLNTKFLRMNRLQEAPPTGGAFDTANDIVCLGCHDKAGQAWAGSAHANNNVATQLYTAGAAAQREFPANTPVWKASCLNCHDTHTVQGARRLLREGTDSTATPKTGGNSAIEQTCYACHTASGTSAVAFTPGTATAVPDIRTDFAQARRMPISDTPEVHDIGTGTGIRRGKDFIESNALLGATPGNRHAECTDCHNPHRVAKTRLFNDPNTLVAAAGTHKHTDDGTDIHDNLASGVLRGGFGVEPVYSSLSFHAMPITFNVKRGDGGTGASTAVGSEWVTREYQICLKCHSNFAYPDDNVYPNSSNRPQLGGPGLTPANANGHSNFTSYTNQAKEFQAPVTHSVAVGSVSRGNEGGTGTAASNNNNHRSWHPVLAPTGRLNRPGSWLAPWNNAGTGGRAGRLGVQTMYCSDCHGSSTGTAASVIPAGGENNSPWGPHGSTLNFLLKGDYSTASGEGANDTLCFKCHSQNAYSGGGGTGWSTDKGDGHNVHSDKIGSPLRCNWCHVAVPHGWMNRSLLVNLLDVGPEAGLPPGTAVPFTNNVGYSNGPYYRRAFLRVISFPASGAQWTEGNCNGGSKDTMKSNCESPN
ncbi:MAG: cytochrome c3 family protein [Sideroxyarcus sp.]|nr:cytochrome c3 family protein [Sideroxyarcus sp.]